MKLWVAGCLGLQAGMLSHLLEVAQGMDYMHGLVRE
jgi:hypothetical protein